MASRLRTLRGWGNACWQHGKCGHSANDPRQAGKNAVISGAAGFVRSQRGGSDAALAGAADDAAPEEALALVRQCAWFSFDAESPWYTHVFWDLGVVAVRPGGRSLAVLAATDTD